MADNPPLDPTLCINPDRPGDSCGDSFDHKTTNRTLRKMLYHSQGPPASGIYEDQNQPSGTDTSMRTLQEIQAETRRNAMAARTLSKGGPKLTTGSQAAAAKGVYQDKSTLYLVPMTSNGTRTDASRILANATRTFPEDIAMTGKSNSSFCILLLHDSFPEALALLLRHWNLEWERDCSESLKVEHISLRLLGNIAIQPHSTLGTLGNFFDTHDRVHGNHPKKILQGPTTLRLASPAIYVEGLISVKDFEEKTRALAPYFVHTDKENKKRKDNPTAHSLASEPKRTRSESSISAALPLRSEIGDLPGFSKISFVFASVSLANDGSVSIEWPNLKGLGENAATAAALPRTDAALPRIDARVAVFCRGSAAQLITLEQTHDKS